MSSEFEGGPTDVIGGANALRILAVDLTVVDGPDRGVRARIARGSGRVGSGKTNALAMTDPSVSRVHCEIEVRADGVALRDLGSTNGTFVDGRRIRDVDVGHGTLVSVGGSTFRVDVGDAPAFVEVSTGSSFQSLLGASAAMRRIYALLEKAAASDATVLVTGETGTGKELVAQALHEASPRAAGPFVTVDCGAIPESLIESELFGHTRGAFTGASSDRKGAFEEAEGGTVFFDEIGELPLTMQPKLLRALESRQVRRVGSNQARRVDVRVVAATHRALARSVNDGTFREDLFYRLAVIEVELPPLRARREDIPALAAHFVERFSGAATPVPPEVLSTLMTRAWPGNVRELRNLIERSVTLGWSASAGVEHRPASASTLPAGLSKLVPIHLPLKEARFAWTEQFELVYVQALLEKTGGNVTRAAERAGVSRRFLQRTLARLGIKSSDADRDD
jgi:DNA-binding NtrC family response regulator